MKTIKVKTFGLHDKNYKWNKPSFKLGKPVKVKKSDKKLSYKKAKKKYTLKPFGDADKDGYLNMFDCKPLDPKKHGVYKKHAKKPVFFYDTKGYGVKPGEVTQSMVFEKLEEKLPDYFGREKGQEGGTYSDRLTKSLLAIEEKKETPVKKIVGVHELETPDAVSQETVFATRHLWDYLKSAHPDKMFKFDIYNPSEVSYVDESGEEKKLSISKAIKMSPTGISAEPRIPGKLRRKLKDVDKYIRESAKVVIKDFEKSTGRKLSSKEKTKLIEDLREQMVSGSDIEDISAGYSYKPHWSIEELPRHFGSRKDVKVHITDDPAEVVMKSMYSGMDSCENVATGMCKMGAFSDVKHRNPVAYIYLTGKEPYKDKPSYRVMLRRGHPVEKYGSLDKSKEFFGVEWGKYEKPSAYGGGSERYRYPFMIQEFLKKKKLFHVPLKTGYTHRGYSDFVAHNVEESYPYLEEEWMDIAEERSSEYDEDYDEYDLESRVANDPVSFSHDIPSVYPKEMKKPKEEIHPPSYGSSVTHILSYPPEKKISRSFFYNLLREKDEDIRLSALRRPEIEIKAQKETIDKIEEKLKDKELGEEDRKNFEKRLRSEKSKLKELMETQPEYYHKMAFDISPRIKKEVAGFPRLQQRTVKSLLPSKDTSITKPLFYNPALTYQQRKEIGKREEGFYDPWGIKKETDPRVAKEAIKITTKTQSPHVTQEIASTTANITAINYIYENYPDLRHRIAKNPNTPEYIISKYISDLSKSNVSKDDKIEEIKNLMDLRSNLKTDTLKKIYRMFGQNTEVAIELYVHDNTPSSIKNKIESRVMKKGYENLLTHTLDYPEDHNINTIYKIIDETTNDDNLNRLMQNLNFNKFTKNANKNLLKKLVNRVKKNLFLQAMFIQMLKENRTIDTEKTLLELYDYYPKDLHREIVIYLMDTPHKTICDKIRKIYG